MTTDPITIGKFTLHDTGVSIQGRPSFDEYAGVLEFCRRAHKAAGWWLVDLLRYGENRPDWKERLGQIIDATGYAEQTLKNLKYLGENLHPSCRRNDLDFSAHFEVAALPPPDQSQWLERAVAEGWTKRDLRLNIRAARRRKVIDGQAVLEGRYRVIYADPPWLYNDRPPSESGAQAHNPGMTIDALCGLPVASHAHSDAVLFLWCTAPMLLQAPGPREVIAAWGFQPKTGMVWDKVRHNWGHYVSIRHEHLIIATRGSCTPDRPTPMIDSVWTERQDDEHPTKPESFRQHIERLYDGPYLELFGRKPVPGWTVFGNDAALWHTQNAAPLAG